MSQSDEVSRLLSLLGAEEAVYRELHAVLQRERVHITELDWQSLEEAVRTKEALADEAALLEESRVELIRALAQTLGLDEERPTLTRICQRLGGGADGLAEAHSGLASLVGSVRELLEINATFAGEALAQVQATLRVLGRLAPARTTYGPRGLDAPDAGSIVRRSA